MASAPSGIKVQKRNSFGLPFIGEHGLKVVLNSINNQFLRISCDYIECK